MIISLRPYRLWMRAAVCVCAVAALCLVPPPATLADAPPPSSLGNVEIIVENSLYNSGEITAAINQYAQDIQLQGYTPTITTTPFADPNSLRTHLADRYNTDGLAGAVFVGDLPVFNFEIEEHTDWSYDYFPCDLYYEDLTGNWWDADVDGRIDTHSRYVAPEIWVGRLQTSNLTGLHPGRTEAGMLNEYFARNHAYRYGNLQVARTGLAYIDDDWASWAGTWGGNLDAAVEGATTIISDGATTTADDYKARIAQEYEHVLLCAHSDSSLHWFKIGDEWTGGLVYNDELEGVDPNVLFYNLFACSNARFTEDGYMAGEYVFGTDMGLLAVGSTKTGSMLEFQDYFNPLGLGETFGDAWLNWWNQRAISGFSTYEKDWHYGMVMIGDPLLVTQEYLPIPEPTTIALLAFGALAALRRRRK